MDSRKFTTNYLIQTVGRGLTMAFGLVIVNVLARALSKSAFGEYTTAMTFLQFFGVMVDFGLTLMLVVMISERGADEKKIVGNVFAMRLVSGIVVFGLAPLAVLAFPYSADVKAGVLVGSLGFLFMAVSTMLVGVFQKHAAMWRAALAEMLNRAVLLGIVLWLASTGAGLVAMIGATVVANLVWLVATLALARPIVNVRPRFDMDVWKDAIHRSWPIALSIAFNLIYLKGDILFLSLFRPSEDVAVYGIAYKVVDVLTALPVMFMGLLLPALVAEWSQGKKAEFRQHLSRAFDVFATITIPLVVGAQAVSVPLIELIAGDKYAVSGPILQLLIFALAAVFFSSLYGHAVVAVNKQKPMIWGYAFVALVSTVGYLALIPRFGSWGAASVTLVSELLIAFITFEVVRRESQAVPSPVVLIKALACSALMYLVLRIIPETNVLLTVAVGATAYFAAMVAIGGIDTKKLAELRKPTV